MSYLDRRDEIARAAAGDERDLRAFIAVDVPIPAEFARALVVVLPEVAALLLASFKTEKGWRVPYGPETDALRLAHSHGLVEVPGTNPSRSHIIAGRGRYLSNFGNAVRRELVKLEEAGELVRR